MLDNSILEQCLARKMSRFVVQDDGRVFLQRLVRHQVETDTGTEWIEVEASAYLAAVEGMRPGEMKMVDDLVPEPLRMDWRLGVQREAEWSVWTPYPQRLPHIDSQSAT